MQVFSQLLSLTRGIASARILIAGGSFAEVASLLLSERGVGVIYGWLGYMLFKWFEFQAKRKGTLETV